jgi:hypothetical protein
MNLLHLIATLVITCTTYLFSDVFGISLALFGSVSSDALFNTVISLNSLQNAQAPKVITDLIVSPAYPLSSVNPVHPIKILDLVFQTIQSPSSATDLTATLSFEPPLATATAFAQIAELGQLPRVESSVLAWIIKFVITVVWNAIYASRRGLKRVRSAFALGRRTAKALVKATPIIGVLFLLVAVGESQIFSHYPDVYAKIKIGDGTLHDARERVKSVRNEVDGCGPRLTEYIARPRRTHQLWKEI